MPKKNNSLFFGNCTNLGKRAWIVCGNSAFMTVASFLSGKSLKWWICCFRELDFCITSSAHELDDATLFGEVGSDAAAGLVRFGLGNFILARSCQHLLKTIKVNEMNAKRNSLKCTQVT